MPWTPRLNSPGSRGLQQLQAIFAGKTGYAGIVKTLDLHPVSAEEGFVVFEGSPTQAVYNPLGSVHGGYAATLWPCRAGLIFDTGEFCRRTRSFDATAP